MSVRKNRLTAVFALTALALAGAASAETIKVLPLSAPPVLDGDGSDWLDIPGTVVRLRKNKADGETPTRSVLIKGGVHGDYVSFYIEWQDSSEDVLHRPWVWDARKKKYGKGAQREDRLAIQFATGGDYSTDWFSGHEFTADMWHWKASRSNPLGLAHDKSTEVSTRKILRSYKGTTEGGQPVYVARPSDSGDELYSTRRYRAYVQNVMPRYAISDSVTGSVADVEARGVWADGIWHLELRRKLDTSHADDVVFSRGEQVIGGLAVFDHSRSDDHAISDTLTFVF